MVSVLLHAPEPLRLRLRVWTHRAQLDAALADGVNPRESLAIELRARQLTRPSILRGIARSLTNVVDSAAEPRHDGSRPPLQREAVLVARDDLLEIATSLRTASEVPAQVAALASLLVWDSASPLYASNTGASVEQWAETVLAAL